MNVIQGPGTQIREPEQARQDRNHAIGLALEWARSAGQEHCTRVPIDEFLDVTKMIEDYLTGKSEKT